MRTALSIGFVALLAACAGATPRPRGEGALQGRWQGSFQHDGIREPVSESVEPSAAGQQDPRC